MEQEQDQSAPQPRTTRPRRVRTRHARGNRPHQSAGPGDPWSHHPGDGLHLDLPCEAARIWELISSLPDGLDTIAGDRGYRFSGGEKQRLALARLLLKAPSVVVLDEATAHLDSESEVAIQRALATALAGRTSLVIAHRLSTVRAADQILVVDGGQIAERGTHDELLGASGVYARLYRTQFAPQAALRSS